MPEINLDGRALSHDLLLTGVVGAEAVLSRATAHRLTIAPGTGYGFVIGSGIVADITFGVGEDGSVQLDPAFASFANANGSTLTIRGHAIDIDARALSHDLLPIGMLGVDTVLSRTIVNPLTVMPASGFSFVVGSGIVADMSYGIARNGFVMFAPSCDGFLAGKKTATLTILGYPIVLDATHADSDLVGIANIGVHSHKSRELIAVLIPAQNYLPQTTNGVCATGFNIGRDGRLTFASAAVGSYVIANSFAPEPSHAGEEVTIVVCVRPDEPALLTPQGSLIFMVENQLLGTANLGVNGEASFRTSALPRGDHEVVVGYAGNQDFEVSSAKVRHHVQ